MKSLTCRKALQIIGMGALAACSMNAAAQATNALEARINPLRDAYYGDLHLHTRYSLDAYVGYATRISPEEAYRFAKGEAIEYMGQPVQRREPLDFLAVTDHAENMGIIDRLDDPHSVVSRSAFGKAASAELASATRPDGTRDKGRLWPSLVIKYTVGRVNPLAQELQAESTSAWQRTIAAANRHYRPGKFTTFIAYEWTSNGDGAQLVGLHRNVIFKGGAAPNPFTSFDARKPEDLWRWLDAIRKQGYEALAIPHNGNLSQGMMYDWVDSEGRAIDSLYGWAREANEPLIEIVQQKGSSETHPLLSTKDEFPFEIFSLPNAKLAGSYARDGLGRGLVLERNIGINPFKFGFVGGSDLHSGLSISAEPDVDVRTQEYQRTLNSSGSLTGVWCESNTRESIYAALRRKESFATSGTRLKLRFFGSWNLDETLLRKRNWIEKAYATGVAMGGDLPARPATRRPPTFIVWAAKDPNGANLDRVQVVKVWEEDGRQKEKVFDVVWSDRRRLGGETSKLSTVGNTVDLKTGRYTNTIGATELMAVWRDPQFEPRHAAAYYLRVLEIPTPRWTTLHAIRVGLPLRDDVPTTIQERGWSSPIWFSPVAGSEF